jgi:hypothetical protein
LHLNAGPRRFRASPEAGRDATLVGVRVAVVLAVLLGVLQAADRAHARPGRMSFVELVERAELIVVGRIERVSGRHFELRIEELVQARPEIDSAAGNVVRVSMFRDWTCASRWKPYRRGQQLFAFLSRSEGTWTAVSAGTNEGEMPIEDNLAYARTSLLRAENPVWPDLKNPPAPLPSAKRYRVYGRAYDGLAFPLEEIKAAVRQHRPLNHERAVGTGGRSLSPA